MAAPVISTTTSVLGCTQNQAFYYQPYATNTPTSWTASGLPLGLAIDPAKGLVYGAPEQPGVYSFSLTASNSTGASAPQIFAMGVEAANGYPTADVTGLIVDLGTSQVRAEAKGELPELPTQADDDDGEERPKPIIFAKLGDVRLYSVRFERDGQPVNLPITSLRAALKNREDEGTIALSGPGDFAQVMLGISTVYRLAVSYTGSKVKAALSEYETDVFTGFSGLMELEWKHANQLLPQVGPDELLSTSQTFGVLVSRDLLAN